MVAHHLKLNSSKTELLLIPATTGPHHDLAISFMNSLIVPSVEARSLGVVLDGRLSFSTHKPNSAMQISPVQHLEDPTLPHPRVRLGASAVSCHLKA
ncbi:hypothetical protein AOLI_G00146640 [Acnodon oligacanthus]